MFIEHKADMAMADWPDAWIVEHVNDILATLSALSQHTIDHGMSRGCVVTTGGFRRRGG